LFEVWIRVLRQWEARNVSSLAWGVVLGGLGAGHFVGGLSYYLGSPTDDHLEHADEVAGVARAQYRDRMSLRVAGQVGSPSWPEEQPVAE
jgi:hypothetical protein